jgi:hypothetical protein
LIQQGNLIVVQSIGQSIGYLNSLASYLSIQNWKMLWMPHPIFFPCIRNFTVSAISLKEMGRGEAAGKK